MHNILIFVFQILLLSLPASAWAESELPRISFSMLQDRSDRLAAVHIQLPQGFRAYSEGSVALKVAPSSEEVQVLYPQPISVPDFADPIRTIQAYEGDLTILLRMPPTEPPLAVRISMALCSSSRCIPFSQTFSIGETLSLSENQSPHIIFQPEESVSALLVSSLSSALFFGFCAGLILNIMPCVLPVLSLKLSVLTSCTGNQREKISSFRRYCLFFSAGILAWFACVSIFMSLFQISWGAIFQHVIPLIILIFFVFMMTLPLFGIGTLPVLNLRTGSKTRSHIFLTGFAATILATPCSGPLLGGVLAWTIRQPFPVPELVFLATGCGMAAPYGLFACFPSTARWIPRTGIWNELVEKSAAFFLLGTILYLIASLPEYLQIPTIAVLLFSACILYCRTRFASLCSSKLRRCAISWISTALIGLGVFTAYSTAKQDSIWEKLPAEAVEQEIGKDRMLLFFTADWCPSCKLLEWTSLTEDRLNRMKRTYGIRCIRIDMTEANPAAQHLLQRLGSVSLPFTVVFESGSRAQFPYILRDLYSGELLENAVQDCMERK
ncbi:MAG: cytochrome c biogenesis protein CcdA [Desulfovibrionaceae bacterium]|nr:cytochrome c biogenesis protein CcdA [Desulfovibrionaceae bacterium]